MIHRLYKPRTDDPRNQTLWLTVYADLMTNLMLVFLAMFGLALMGDDAILQAMQSMRSVASDSPVFNQEVKFKNLTDALEEELHEIQGITIKQDMDATRISFGEAVLFNSGEAKLKQSATPVLKSVANYLQLLPYTVVVEGHTDLVPMKPGSIYKDNNELSLARAMSVVKILSQEYSLPPGQFAAAAYGSFRPIETNETEDGRRMNRRVEIALFRDFPYEL